MPTLEVISKAKQGDTAAFEQLVTEYLTPVYNYCCWISGSRDAGEILTQKIFIQAWHQLPQYADCNCFTVWLFRGVIQTLADEQRKQHSFIALCKRKLKGLFIRAPTVQHIIDSTPEDEQLKRFTAASASLSLFDRQVIALRLFGRLNNRQIGLVMDMEEDDIRRIVSTAMLTLADSYFANTSKRQLYEM